MKLVITLSLAFLLLVACGRNEDSMKNHTVNLVLGQNKQNSYKSTDAEKITKLDTDYVKVSITFIQENKKKYFKEKYFIPVFGYMVKKKGALVKSNIMINLDIKKK